MLHQRRNRRQHSPVRLQVRLLSLTLIVATWRGPIPCLHSHVHDVHAAANDPDLVRHLCALHSEESGEPDAHWHFHFLLLRDLRGHVGGTPDEPEPDDPVQAQQIGFQSSGLDVRSYSVLERNPLETSIVCAVNSSVPACCTRTSERPRSGGDIGDSFLSSLLLAAPLCAVTGVALC